MALSFFMRYRGVYPQTQGGIPMKLINIYGYFCWAWYFKVKPWIYHHTVLKINQRKIDRAFYKASQHD